MRLIADDEQGRDLGRALVRMLGADQRNAQLAASWHPKEHHIGTIDREIGIRLALGATGGSAIRLVLRDAGGMIATGMAIALPCVAALGRVIQLQLFGVTATDPATVTAAALLLAAGALAAAFIPAWRASNVSPTDALRLD